MTDYYPKVKRNKKGQTVTNCPECGKELLQSYIGETAYCSLMCETNFKYRMNNRDEYGKPRSPEEVKKL